MDQGLWNWSVWAVKAYDLSNAELGFLFLRDCKKHREEETEIKCSIII